MQKVVVVTGASTGIGYDAVRILAENNFLVVATVRKETDKQNILKNFPKNVKVILLDVQHFSEVEKLPQILLNDLGITEVFGLVNNAGVAHAGPFAYQKFSDVSDVIGINILALMKVTQVLLPIMGLETGAPGRIVNISSIAGRVSTPFLSVYAASKHAVEGFSEGLRQELVIKNIKVSVVGPGSIKTPIWEKGFERIKDSYNHTLYAESFQRFVKFGLKQVDRALEPSAVSECILDALTAENPKYRYKPIPQMWLNWYLPKLIPRKYFDRIVVKTLKLLPK